MPRRTEPTSSEFLGRLPATERHLRASGLRICRRCMMGYHCYHMGGRTRTSDLRIMSPTSSHFSTPATLIMADLQTSSILQLWVFMVGSGVIHTLYLFITDFN